MKNAAPLLVFIAVVFLMIFSGAFFIVNEMEQVIITQFGKPVREPIVTAGLKFKIPFVQKVNRIEKRILQWDGNKSDMPTAEKVYVTVDTYGRWRIKEPLKYFLKLNNARRAESRMEDILGSETRNAVARHKLVEIIRSTAGREPETENNNEGVAASEIANLLPISKGRAKIEKDIFEAAAGKLDAFGIELLDVRFKRINYNPSVRPDIYNRMITERKKIADKFRSEGQGLAAEIEGRRERELLTIQSQAYKEIEEIRGKADAQATDIYAQAYNQGPAAIELYEFMKSMETYKQVLDKQTTLILTTDSELFKFLKDIDGGSGIKAPAPGGQ